MGLGDGLCPASFRAVIVKRSRGVRFTDLLAHRVLVSQRTVFHGYCPLGLRHNN